MNNKHTPGPWQWELNEKNKQITLCGGATRYDLSVMDFTRWGMGGATPRFLNTNDGFNTLAPAIDYAEIVEGREHHAHWFKTVNHPDAKLIAAAPELLEALQNAANFLKHFPEYSHYASCKAAIKKATE